MKALIWCGLLAVVSGTLYVDINDNDLYDLSDVILRGKVLESNYFPSYTDLRVAVYDQLKVGVLGLDFTIVDVNSSTGYHRQ